jgi:dynein heavy chain 1
MFEVQDLRYATLATVSRCGMVWFSEDVLSVEMVFENFMSRLKNIPLDDSDDVDTYKIGKQEQEEVVSPLLQVSFTM